MWKLREFAAFIKSSGFELVNQHLTSSFETVTLNRNYKLMK